MARRIWGSAVKLFVLGYGYSAERFVALNRHRLESVTGTVRSADKAARLARPGLTLFAMEEAASASALRAALADSDAILVSVPPSAQGDPALNALRDDLAAWRGRAIVYLSTIGVYGDHGGAWIDEETPPAPGQERSRWRLAAERDWQALEGEGRAVHVLRLAGIYGPGRNALANLAQGTAHRIVKPGQVFNRIHVDDIAKAIGAAIACATSVTLNVTDDEPAPPQDVVTFAAGLMGVAPPPEIPFAEAMLSPMARSFYAENKRVRNQRLRDLLQGPLACPTYREGLTALWLQGEGRARN